MVEERRVNWRGRHPETCSCVTCSETRIERTDPVRRQAEQDRRYAETREREGKARRARLERLGLLDDDPRRVLPESPVRAERAVQDWSAGERFRAEAAEERTRRRRSDSITTVVTVVAVLTIAVVIGVASWLLI